MFQGWHIYLKWAIVLASLLHVAAQSSAPSPLQLSFASSPYAKVAGSRRLVKRNDSLAVDIEGFRDFSSIIVNATLGTPPQSFQFLVDTGSADLLVISTLNSECTASSDLCNLGTFDESSSSSYTKYAQNFNVSYADGTGASGSYGYDDLTLGGTKIDSLQFGLAQTSTIGENILGLGYIGIESGSGPYANLPLRLYVDGTTNIIGYSIWFDGPNLVNGKLALGAIDTGKFNGTLETLPIQLDRLSLTYDFATVSTTGISASTNGTSMNFDNSSISVILDAGTSTILLPQNVFIQVLQYLGAEYDASVGLPIHNRSSIATDTTLDFTFGTTTVQIPVADLAIPISTNNDEQVALLLSSSSGVDNILGVPFFRNAYVVFDYSHNQVSLAQALYSSDDNVTLIGQNGVIGLASTAHVNQPQDGPSGSPGNSTTNSTAATSPTSQPNNGLSSSAKIGIGVGIGLGVPILLAIIAAIFFHRKRKRREAAAAHELKTKPANAEPANKYGKAELPATASGATVKEKAELSAQNQRYELDNTHAHPAELPASIPEPQELATEYSVPGSMAQTSRT